MSKKNGACDKASVRPGCPDCCLTTIEHLETWIRGCLRHLFTDLEEESRRGDCRSHNCHREVLVGLLQKWKQGIELTEEKACTERNYVKKWRRLERLRSSAAASLKELIERPTDGEEFFFAFKAIVEKTLAGVVPREIGKAAAARR